MGEISFTRDDLDFGQIKLPQICQPGIDQGAPRCLYRPHHRNRGDSHNTWPEKSNIYFLLSGRLRIHLSTPEGEPIAILGPVRVSARCRYRQQPASAFVVARRSKPVAGYGSRTSSGSLVRAPMKRPATFCSSLTKRLRQTQCLDQRRSSTGE